MQDNQDRFNDPTDDADKNWNQYVEIERKYREDKKQAVKHMIALVDEKGFESFCDIVFEMLDYIEILEK